MSETFVHGVAAGDPTTDGAVLQTCVSGVDGDAFLRWDVADEDAPDRLLATGGAVAAAAADHTVRVVVTGLPAGRRYRYRFSTSSGSVCEGRFRTLAEDPRRLRFAVVCCAKHNAGYFNAYGRVAARDDLDLVLHVGDYIYEAANVPPASQTPGADIGRDVEPLEECRSLDDYRTRYRQYRRDTDLQALHATHAGIHLIDDHELADNAWSGGSQEHHPDRDGPWEARAAQALQAWREWIPSRVDPARGEPIWRSTDVGALARLLVLETRTSRSAPGEDRTQVGAEQERWLDGELERGPAPAWFLLAMPSPMTRFWRPGLSALTTEAFRKLKLVEPDGSGPATDRWDGFETERARLLARLASVSAPRLMVSGDVHVALDHELTAPDGAFAGVAATAPSVSSQNLDDKMGWAVGGSAAHEAAVLHDLPDLRWCDLDHHGYLIVDLGHDRAAVEWWGVDEVLRPSRGERLLHRIEIDRTGRSVAVEVGR